LFVKGNGEPGEAKSRKTEPKKEEGKLRKRAMILFLFL
jgi:hypothetical protein